MGLWFIFVIIVPISELFTDGHFMELQYFLIIVTVFSPLLYLAYNAYKKFKRAPENKYVTFNRKEMLLTMPRYDENEYFTIPFQHLKATRRRIAMTKFNASGIQLQFFNETKPQKLGRHEFIVMESAPFEPWARWSLYVWYMDKNRPLPPGEVFDEFRTEDFERRKAEGFPPPLFKSCIPTPEATSEQQAEREEYWKDEEYRATEKEAKYDLGYFSK